MNTTVIHTMIYISHNKGFVWMTKERKGKKVAGKIIEGIKVNRGK